MSDESKEVNDSKRESFVSRNSASIIGITAVVLMILATVLTMLKR